MSKVTITLETADQGKSVKLSRQAAEDMDDDEPALVASTVMLVLFNEFMEKNGAGMIESSKAGEFQA